jgi:electron transfer flavoprotein alpha subunit
MTILIIAEHNHVKLKPSTYVTVGAAQKLGGAITIFVGGKGCQSAAEEAAKIEGVQSIICCDDGALGEFLAEPFAEAILSIARDYQHIMAPASTFGKNILPRVAGLLDVAQISDIIGIESADTFIRPIYAGNGLATVRSSDPIKVITVRTTSFPKAATGNGQASITSHSVSLTTTGLTRFVGREESKSDRPELTAARVVISGGRGLQSRENFKLIEKLADSLNAAVGASRAAVDAGYVPNDYQVGQTGKVVAPELYIAVGISGAIQHLAGMKESKVIVAINKDEEAPIFQIADYGLVGDLFQIVPELTEAVQGLKKG